MQARDETCGFEGNSELYGLGIRLGVYFQWTTALLVYAHYEKGRHALQKDYTIFLFAITIAIIITTAQAAATYDVEILILTYIIFGGIIIVFSTNAKQTQNLIEEMLKEGHRLRWSDFVEVFTLAGVGIYCSWFWINGISAHFTKTPCGSFGFLFTKVSLYTPSIRHFFAFISVLFTILVVISLILTPWTLGDKPVDGIRPEHCSHAAPKLLDGLRSLRNKYYSA